LLNDAWGATGIDFRNTVWPLRGIYFWGKVTSYNV
jgi:hypothetical protein